MSFLEPDRYFSRLSHVDIDRDILALGLRNVLLDVDNTIFTRDTHEVPRDVGFWLAKARDAGVAFCLVSNNWHGGVYQLARRLSLPLVAKAVKPLPPAFLIALKKIGAQRSNTVVVGDQLVTDVMGAHFLGMPAYLLAPLVEQDLPHTLLLRNFERLVMGERQPEGAGVPSAFQPAERLDDLAEEAPCGQRDASQSAPYVTSDENVYDGACITSTDDRVSGATESLSDAVASPRAKEQVQSS